MGRSTFAQRMETIAHMHHQVAERAWTAQRAAIEAYRESRETGHGHTTARLAAQNAAVEAGLSLIDARTVASDAHTAWRNTTRK
jgi:hypothetical protein